MFLMAHPVNGVLDADSARNIFMKSNLSVDQLAQIWNLADVRNSGTLNQAEFVVAMHYIAGIMDGSISSLPSSLPPAIYNSAAGRSTPTSPVSRQFSGDRSLSPSFGHRFPSSSPSLQKQAITRQFTGSPLQAQASLSIASAFTAPAAANTHWDVTDQEKQKFDNFFDKIDSRGTGFIQGMGVTGVTTRQAGPFSNQSFTL
jgi:epidermal growth factor receptor substrate 15